MNRMMAVWALVCAAVPSVAQKTQIDYDHKSDFARYKTYSWAPSTDAQSPDAAFPNQLMQERIAGWIEEMLAAKRITRVKSGGDLVVGYQVKVTEQPQYTTFTDAPGPGWGWAGGWGSAISTTTTQTILQGTLVVDMIDSHHNQLIFQGVSTGTISSKPEKNSKKFRKSVNEIFEKYPPQP